MTTYKILFLIFLTASLAQSAVRSIVSSAFLARGEKAILEIRVEGQEPDEFPKITAPTGLEIQSLGFGRPQMFPGRRVESSIRYLLSSYEVGIHEIPAIEVSVSGTRQFTKPLKIEIFNPDELTWKEIKSEVPGEQSFRYATIIRVPQRKFFENQTFPSEIKVYIPREIAESVMDWGSPEYSRDGLAVWRYEASKQPGEINLLGRPHVSLAYNTTVTALRSGEVELGPATVRIIYGQMIFDRFAQRVQIQSVLDIAAKRLEITPLPAGAPEGFDNAVGRFELETSMKVTEVTEGEPLSLDVIISGSGNLDNLRSPRLMDDKGWKIYDASATQRGEERRDLEGSVVFSQFLRPLEMKSALPPFRLVFFDPDLEKYETVSTPEIPLQMIPAKAVNPLASAAPQSLPVPLEKMTDILGLIDSKNLLIKPNSKSYPLLIHLVAMAIVCFLITRSLWLRYGHLLQKDERKRRIQKELSTLSRESFSDQASFLKAICGFSEKWQLIDTNSELKAIRQERDLICFTPEKQNIPLDRLRRIKLIQVLKKAAFSILFAILSMQSLTELRAEDPAVLAKTAFNENRFEEAAKIWLNAGPFETLSADTIYNIGNAAYRMGSPGHASLFYRRALLRDSRHAEARQNLRFLERKYGAISIDRAPFQYTIATVSLDVWKSSFFAATWLLIISLLIFPATRSDSRWRLLAIIGFILTPLMLTFSAVGYKLYPKDGDFSPITQQAVIIAADVVLHTDAARTSPEVIDAPPGSVLQVLKQSGEWSYVAFATKTRGWILNESIEMILPKGKVRMPEIKKTKSDASST